MTPQAFRYWLKGYLALFSENGIDIFQVRIIRNHAKLVYGVQKRIDVDIDFFIQALERELLTSNIIAKECLISCSQHLFA